MQLYVRRRIRCNHVSGTAAERYRALVSSYIEQYGAAIHSKESTWCILIGLGTAFRMPSGDQRVVIVPNLISAIQRGHYNITWAKNLQIMMKATLLLDVVFKLLLLRSFTFLFDAIRIQQKCCRRAIRGTSKSLEKRNNMNLFTKNNKVFQCNKKSSLPFGLFIT